MQFRLSEGSQSSERPSAAPTAPTSLLSSEETDRLLSRLPAIKAETADRTDFALRERSLPVPVAGQTISESFPPAAGSAAPEVGSAGPLEILRFAPEGEIEMAPHLSVTFSQPMVALGAQGELAAADGPVKLTPQPKGKWRWLGTSTLVFEPEKRFPMATRYRVEIPAGLKSLSGGRLAAGKSYEFATPAPRLIEHWPSEEPQTRNPLIFLAFDQEILPEQMLEQIKLLSGQSSWRLRLATTAEIEENETLRGKAGTMEKGRWMALRVLPKAGASADQPLPAGRTFFLAIKSGATSAEGPRATEKAQGFDFETYHALKLVGQDCGWDRTCRPYSPIAFEFNNPLDPKTVDASRIKFSPPVERLKVTAEENAILLEAATKGRTTYTITLDAEIGDLFGQRLGREVVRTVNVASAASFLTGNGENLVVIDPYGAPAYSIYTINQSQVKVSLHAVEPGDWAAYHDYLQSMSNEKRTPPGRLIKTERVAIKGEPDEISETAIDLSPALKNGYGQVLLIVEAGEGRSRNARSLTKWIQATRIGLDAMVDSTRLVGWATSLKDGKPIEGVQVELLDWRGQGRKAAMTDKQGLARFDLPVELGLRMLVARAGDDVAILPERDFSWGSDTGEWNRRFSKDAVRWHVLDDRGMYRPGEEVHIKGWVRRLSAGTDGDVRLFSGNLRQVRYTLRDSRYNDVAQGMIAVNAVGGFHAVIKLPPTINLGHATLTLTPEIPGVGSEDRHDHRFQVQEFRRPEYEAKVTLAEAVHLIGGHADLTVAANYYAGGALPNAEVTWQVTSMPATYTPPNRDDFIFGKWVPWWIRPSFDDNEQNRTLKGRTDAAGKHHLRIDFDSVDPPRPTTITAQATVMDVNRQPIAGITALLVHPAELYVGIRSPRTFVQKGEPVIVESIVTDIDGKSITGREIRLRAVLMDWVFEAGEWKERETNPKECVVVSGSEPVVCRWEMSEGGRYRITAEIRDERERRNRSEMTVWVAGGKLRPQRDVEQETAELIPDRREYRAGEIAKILVQAPFYPAEGKVTLRRSGLVSIESFSLTGPSHTLEIPISEAYVPNIEVQVDLVGAAARIGDAGEPLKNAPPRPAFAKGSLTLSVPPLQRRLTVTAQPREKALEPGGETIVDVELRDAAGKPAPGAEVALIVVDEAVLALSYYNLIDPIDSFYQPLRSDVSDHYFRSRILLANPEQLIARLRESREIRVYSDAIMLSADAVYSLPSSKPLIARSRRFMMQVSAEEVGGGVGESQPIRARIDFNALAIFAPTMRTDAEGRAWVKVKLPDNLTRYRVMAVAAAGENQFGKGESSITARLPLMARPSAPRFLNFGDRFELPVVIQNQTDAPVEVDVAVRAGNLELTDGAGRRVTVPANDRAEVRFPATTVQPGTARIQIAAASGKWADAAEISLPVWTPATTEAFAAYGEIDEGVIRQAIAAPADVFTAFGGLEITTSSTQLQALTDAVIYLVNYPFDCSEQISSRILSIAALRDVLGAFDAQGLPPADELEASVKRDLERLDGMQNDDGGFGFWRKGDESWPYLSIHAAHALARAKAKGFALPANLLEDALGYVKSIDRHLPADYPEEAKRVLRAYALYVRAQAGDRQPAKARELIVAAGGARQVPLEALGWLLPVVQRAEIPEIERHLLNRVEETAGAAHFATSYSDGAHLLLHSNRRIDGILLEALIGINPKSDLIPKLARGLLAHRTKGRWSNTQENAFILLALDRYFQTFEKVTPNFVARAWLGEAYAGEHEFKGRTTERHRIDVPMRYLTGPAPLILSKEGQGRLYYRLGMQFAPTSLQLDPLDRGFTVTRVYEAIDDPGDVRLDEDGTWRIKAGASVRVKLRLVAPARRYHVALVDPLPAGFEAMNPALAVTGQIPREVKKRDWWSWPWYDHQNLRDERVEAFTSLLWDGVYEYSYVARATTPGRFIVPPARAEEMYQPETFGRSGTNRVIVE